MDERQDAIGAENASFRMAPKKQLQKLCRPLFGPED